MKDGILLLKRNPSGGYRQVHRNEAIKVPVYDWNFRNRIQNIEYRMQSTEYSIKNTSGSLRMM